MIRRVVRSAASIAAALVSIATIALPLETAGDTAKRAAIEIASGSELWMEGKSTLHDWESRTNTLNVGFTIDPIRTEPIDATGVDALVRAGGVLALDVEIPVKPLHSGKAGLDKNMMKALKAEQFPMIRFHMSRYTVTGPATADTLSLSVVGELIVAGKNKPVTLEARAWQCDAGVWVAGTAPLNMTDFDITPPTMMMGAIKTNNRIVIHYRLLLAPAGRLAGSGIQTAK